ncbi:MAG: hypothetical protein JRN19_03275 [Nitrososphaerota archaeon]|nr:hypothetical protein [Nitrososphaerota archaeon]MDG7048619.1 hypothetical protein [Nitrososphaerota archaeon]MDG7051452.1 hypothetical protein [Nitrososphaerota archaeon]
MTKKGARGAYHNEYALSFAYGATSPTRLSQCDQRVRHDHILAFAKPFDEAGSQQLLDRTLILPLRISEFDKIMWAK